MYQKRSFMRIFNLALAGMVALAVMAAALPQPAQAAVCDETHVVQGGETIWRIAKDYEVTVNRLAKTNGLVYPYPLTVGQTLCIPETTPANTSAKWSATYTEGKVEIEGTGFKKDYTFFLRVRENDASTWFKLGKFSSDGKGRVDEAFKLPKELQKKTALNVCLKDAVTDGLICKRVYRQ